MGKDKQKKGRRQAPAVSRPMQGMDQKRFRLNDVVPIVINNPVNSTDVLVII